ncbi:nuclear transport factor 2 family protein [Mycobacterium hubeiense]|uniref:nuclear transport factor 2 family protein n=1 Tax=Mycobacterium hubeiense TaxID=1867256 RepID=UPI000C7ED2DA|nr:nuclear transport factor 2 family protein [Mycobacterium sp. QGD 101]
MTMTYQQQYVLDGMAGRAAILDLTARYNRLYSSGDIEGWIACFRHSGATIVRGGETLTDLRAAFNGGGGKRLVTVDHEIAVDGVDATQRCVALLFVGAELRATGLYTDRLIYERGGWYFTSRELEWDVPPP